jgi:TP901 family phage tail tape measure protein
MAAEVFRIEIPINVEDNTDPGVKQAQAKMTAFDKVNQKTQKRLQEMNRTKWKVALEAIDKVSSVISRIDASVRGLAGKAWRITMSVVDKATAPLRGIINILKNPILQAGAILGVSVGLKDTIDTFSTFEQTMSKVAAISGATADQMVLLTDKAKQMGATTKYTASEAGDAFTYMAMAGWKTDDMLSGIEGIMSLAAASGEDLATTSDIVTDALTAFGLQAKDSSHFSDVLAAASSNANTTVSGMGETFKYVGTMAGALGYSIEDVALATGLMANAGVKGTMAGTSLNSIISRLATNTSGARDAISALGIQFYNADGSARDLGNVLGELRTATAGMSSAQKSNLANTIAGVEAQKGLLAILNASETDYAKLTEAIENADGASQKMADTMLDNLAGSMTLLQSAADGVKLTLGNRLSPYLRSFVDWLTSKMPNIDEAVSKTMDFVDEKVAQLKETVADFTSSDEWANADIWGKISIAWDAIVAEPFEQWWNNTGKAWLAGKMGSFGQTIGSGITAGLLALLGLDTGGAIEDGKTIGASFIDGFMAGFDTERITQALSEWASDHKGSVAAAGAIGGLKFIGTAANLIQKGKGAIDNVKGLFGKGGTAGGLGTLATNTMNVTAAIVNITGGAGAASKAAGQALSNLPALGGGAGSLALPASAGSAAGGGEVVYTVLKNGVGVAGTGGAITEGLATIGTSLGSGATTMGGAALAGGLSVGGILGGIAGLVGAGIDLFQGIGKNKSGDKAGAKSEFFSAGAKTGMVGAGAGIGAAVGSIVPGIGTAIGAAVGAGVGGIASIFSGDKLGSILEEWTSEGGWMNTVGTAISGFFTETLPEKWGEFWDGVGDFFSETVPYAIGYAAGKVTTFFTETLPTKWDDFWTGVGNFFTESIPAWWENTKETLGTFFTETLPTKWDDFWTGVGNFFTESIPAWWENTKETLGTFFTETLPTKWTSFWDGVGNFFTETIPAWVENSVAGAKTFFTETLPSKWTSFWSGVGEKISGFFGGIWDKVSGAFSAGYDAGTGGGAEAHAWGGVMTRPHLGLVAEDGPESIIPLSPSKRGRGLDLWEETGKALGVVPYAEGGIEGDVEYPMQTPVSTTAPGGQVIEVKLDLSPSFVIEAREGGMSEDDIVRIIKTRIREMVDDIGDELAERLARIFANMPAKGAA